MQKGAVACSGTHSGNCQDKDGNQVILISFSFRFLTFGHEHATFIISGIATNTALLLLNIFSLARPDPFFT